MALVIPAAVIVQLRLAGLLQVRVRVRVKVKVRVGVGVGVGIRGRVRVRVRVRVTCSSSRMTTEPCTRNSVLFGRDASVPWNHEAMLPLFVKGAPGEG